MEILAFDPTEMREAWQDKGWFHARPGVSEAFLAHLEAVVADLLADRPLEGAGLAGAKDQFLFELPDGVDLGAALFDGVCKVTGLDRAGMTLSERHIKAYLGDADPHPPPHKDRSASTVALGVSVRVPDGSHVVLYPDDEREENPLLGPGLNAYLPPDRQPDTALAAAREVVIHDRPGDVIAFHGSSTWHLRRNSAQTVILYFKFNDFGSDPLAEDPTTDAQRSRSLAAVSAGGASLDSMIPRFSRRFDAVVESFDRRTLASGRGRWMATVWERPPIALDAADVAFLRDVDGTATVSELAASHGIAPVARLVSCGVLDLS